MSNAPSGRGRRADRVAVGVIFGDDSIVGVSVGARVGVGVGATVSVGKTVAVGCGVHVSVAAAACVVSVGGGAAAHAPINVATSARMIMVPVIRRRGLWVMAGSFA